MGPGSIEQEKLHDLVYVLKELLWLLRGEWAIGGKGGGWETSKEIIVVVQARGESWVGSRW